MGVGSHTVQYITWFYWRQYSGFSKSLSKTWLCLAITNSIVVIGQTNGYHVHFMGGKWNLRKVNYFEAKCRHLVYKVSMRHEKGARI